MLHAGKPLFIPAEILDKDGKRTGRFLTINRLVLEKEGMKFDEMRFIDYSTVELASVMGCDLHIVDAARVSTGSGSSESEQKNFGLISYLMRHKHGSPFEHNAMTFKITTPIFVWREFMRHRIGFSYNEQSARYTTLEPVFYIPPPERPLKKVNDWKAARPVFNTADEETLLHVTEALKASYVQSYETYLKLLAMDIDPGLARDSLPVGIFSTAYVTCNTRSLMNFLELRTSVAGKSFPLFEIEAVASQMEKFFDQFFPLTYTAFNDNGRVAP